MKRILFFVILLLPFFAHAQYTGTGSVSRGRGTVTTANLFPGCAGGRVSAVGSVTSTDSKVWTIPAATNYVGGTRLPDLYNQCAGVTPANIGAVNLSTVPTVIIDSAGTVITGYLFGDNYFELYINGVLVGVDPVPYTPFNSCVVKFKVSMPYTIAVKLVDWEENIGLGTELNGGNPYHAGDGGFIASFSDGTVTDASWKAQTFYIAPIEDLSKVVELADSTRSSAGASTTPTCDTTCYAIHYAVPSNWNLPSFSDAGWPQATLFTDATVGVSMIPAYTNFPSLWSGVGARFIWSSNLILDNEVLVRKTVGGTSSIDDKTDTKLALHLFPNPAENMVFLDFGKDLTKAQFRKIEIFNSIGECCYSSENVVTSISLSEFSAGIYFVKVQIGEEQITQKLIVK